MVGDPEFLICDEVTSGLDPLSEDQIIALLRSLVEQQGKTFLCTIHNLGKLPDLDHITVLYQGRLVFQGDFAALQAWFGIEDPLKLYHALAGKTLEYWLEKWENRGASDTESRIDVKAHCGRPAEQGPDRSDAMPIASQQGPDRSDAMRIASPPPASDEVSPLIVATRCQSRPILPHRTRSLPLRQSHGGQVARHRDNKPYPPPSPSWAPCCAAALVLGLHILLGAALVGYGCRRKRWD